MHACNANRIPLSLMDGHTCMHTDMHQWQILCFTSKQKHIATATALLLSSISCIVVHDAIKIELNNHLCDSRTCN